MQSPASAVYFRYNPGMTQHNFHITSEAGDRLDRVLANLLDGVSRATVQSLVKSGDILVNGKSERASYRMNEGDHIEVTMTAAPDEGIQPEDIPLDVLHEDNDLIAINKPAGMVVHPAHGHHSGTLVNAALHRWPGMAEVGEPERAGVVHRLDKETSGVLVMAKTTAALENLQHQFQAHIVRKRYITLVEGMPHSDTGIIDAPIGRDSRTRKRMAVLSGGRASVTHYSILEVFDQHTLLNIELETGRTHQIRVHLAWLGHPVVGDTVYGYRKQRIKMKRFFLHATELEIDSPSTGHRLAFHAPLPTALEAILKKLRQPYGDQ